MADVTINNLTGQAPTSSDVFPFSTTGITPSTYKATLAQMKTAMSLNNVENKSSATIRSEITSSNVTTALGYTPYNSSNPSGYITSSSLPSSSQLAKAWVNFNGTGSIGANQTIRNQYNVSSVYKNTDGDYTINFSSSLPSADFACAGMAWDNNNNSRVVSFRTTPSSSSLRVVVTDYGYNLFNSNRVTVIVFG